MSKITDTIITKLVPGGKGIGRAKNKIVFVPEVIPGEQVRLKNITEKNDYLEAEPEQIITPSPHRRTPVCLLAGICGGCQWQHIEYDEQLQQKKNITTETLSRAQIQISNDFECVPSKEFHYRNRVQLHRDNDGKVGFMARKSNRIVPVDFCPIAVNHINNFLSNPPQGSQKRFLVMATDTSFANEETDKDKDLSVMIKGKTLHFSIECFFQSNMSLLDVFIDHITHALEGNILMDLYCGVGMYSSFLKDRFNHIIAVEENMTALNYAVKNLGQDENEFFGLRVEEWIDQGRNKQRADTVIVNPPRTGLSKKVSTFLGELGAPSLVYVSCSPVTLTRDMKHLLEANYSLKSLRLFDFYPHTPHVECVAKLVRK